MAKNRYFEPVDTKVSFPELEKKRLSHWYSSGVVKRYLQRNDKSDKYFSFMDGPITANNPMGVHHAWGRTYKDLWQRYKNMQGYKQRFQNGFDCQGLWVEVEVEKELGLKNKKDIENLVPGDRRASIDKFINLCKERVYKFASIQTEQTKRLGNFMDWENSYFTLSDENNYMIWHFLKVCHEKGWIYKGRDSVPWCPRCETAISQHEMLTEDYKELTHETVFFKLPVLNRDFSLVAWTTTPWTIPANMALAVNPKFIYKEWENEETKEKVVLLREDQIPSEEKFDEFVKNMFSEGRWKAVKDHKGKDLVGLKYTAPFDHLPRVKDAKEENTKTFHTVVSAEDLVVATKGTGILHVAPGAGQEDFQLSKKENLSVISVIDDTASYLDGMDEFSGQNAKKHPEIIIDFLKNKDGGKFLFKTMRYTHRYPACWRCKTELVWKVADEWYIAMDKKDPKDKEKRTLREKMKAVSKKIKWLPSFGLDRELDWLSNMHDWLISKPNRYWGLALPIYECQKCGFFEVIGSKEELREKAVSGFSEFKGHSPHKPWIDEVKIKCEKCGESVERLPDVGNPWLDAGIVPFSTIKWNNKGEPLYKKDRKEWEKWFPVDFITESFPGQFKNWFYSLIAMSTVLEDKNPFETVLGYATLLAEDGRAMHKSWGNSIEFNEGADKMGADVMRFMFAKTNPSENMLFGYKNADETRRQFHLKLWNVYNYFVTYANLSEWKPSGRIESSTPLDKWILSRLGGTIKTAADALDEFSAQEAANSIYNFVDDLSLWYIRRSRDRVDNAFYETTYRVLVNLSQVMAPITPFISDEIYTNLTKKDSVHLSDWPKVDDSLIDKDLEKKMSLVREIVEMAHAIRKEKQIKVRQPLSLIEVKNSPLEIDELTSILCDEINVKRASVTKGEGDLLVELNTDLSDELVKEGEARELMRQIQDERKNMGTFLDEMVDVTLPDWPVEFEDEIKKKALVRNLKKGDFEVVRVS